MDWKEIKPEDLFKGAVHHMDEEKRRPISGGVIIPPSQHQIQHLWQTIRELQKRIEYLEAKTK